MNYRLSIIEKFTVLAEEITTCFLSLFTTSYLLHIDK